METFIAVVLLAQGKHHQTRFFGEFRTLEACQNFTHWETKAAMLQGIQSVTVCVPQSQFRKMYPAGFIEEPST